MSSTCMEDKRRMFSTNYFHLFFPNSILIDKLILYNISYDTATLAILKIYICTYLAFRLPPDSISINFLAFQFLCEHNRIYTLIKYYIQN